MQFLKNPKDILIKEFDKISNNTEAINSALNLFDIWMNNPLYEPQKKAILEHIEKKQYELLLDSFYQQIPFGTGGKRGRVGYGPNRINQATVALSVQGYCNYIRNKYPDIESPFVIVAFDVRIFTDIASVYSFFEYDHPVLNLRSRDLAYIACEIFAGNDFKILTYGPKTENKYLSTPELSFLIKNKNAIGGINISASHNHPDDNGFKFYNNDGSQDIPPYDEELSSYMFASNIKVKSESIENAIKNGLLNEVTDQMHKSYIDNNKTIESKKISKPYTFVFSPLCGTGDSNLGQLLRESGYKVKLYNPHSTFDGTFASIPSRIPNPEVPESAQPATKFADQENASCLLSTDPDSDRIGLYVKTSQNQWKYITGNDIASLIVYYLTLDENGPHKKGLIIKTLVTTRTIESIAKEANCPIVSDLLVGFKYIAHVLRSLELNGKYNNIVASTKDFLVACEESHGILLKSNIRDKDSSGPALVLCELITQLKNNNIFVDEYLEQLHLRCGNFCNAARSIVCRGIQGSEIISKMMESLRKNPPKLINNLNVIQNIDYLNTDKFGPIKSKTDRLSRNLLVFNLDGARVVIRPSGTEPKLKLYVDIEGNKIFPDKSRKIVEQSVSEFAQVVMDTCLERVNITLSPTSKLLPDYIELNKKINYEKNMKAALISKSKDILNWNNNARMEWIKKLLSIYADGASLLIAKPTLINLCDSIDDNDEHVKNAVKGIKELILEIDELNKN